MGCDIAYLQTHTPPVTDIRGVLSSFQVVPTKFSPFFSSKNPILYSIGFRRSFYSAVDALRTEKEEVGELIYTKYPEKIRPCDELKGERSRFRLENANGGRSEVVWFSKLLKDCSAELSLTRGKEVHGRIVRSETEPDIHLWVSLINFYAKCGALEFSSRVFDEMPLKDVVAWTALISGFVVQGYGVESVELFCRMRREDVRPNDFTLSTVLKGCSLSSDLEFGKQLHAEVVKSGLLSDVYIGSNLIDLYSKCGEIEYADGVFCLMPEKNDVLWNNLLNGYADIGNGEAVFRLFCQMGDPEVRFSSHTLSIVLKGIASWGASKAGQAVHSIVVKIRGELDDFVSCSLVNMYSKCGLAIDALEVFKMIKNPDIVAWSSIISVLEQQGENEEAAKLFNSMRRSGMRPNQFTLSSLVSNATNFCDHLYGESIHACALKFGVESDHSVSNALIKMYMEFRLIDDGFHIFNKMSNLDVVSWNALLAGYHDDETSDQGPRIFTQMLADGFRPNMYTFISILRSCSSLLNIELGKQVHSRIIKDNFANNEYIGTRLVEMYATCGHMDNVETIFNSLNEKDVVTWTVIISGYLQAYEVRKAVNCFNQMRREGVTPNEYTLASFLKSCSVNASLEGGRQLHSLTIKTGHSTEMYIASILVDMYGKCGCMDEAETLFNGLKSSDTVLWNTIIGDYSYNGEGDKALEAFRKMTNEGVLPDGFTLVNILSACNHMGLVEDGKKYFDSMSESYGITPSIAHYACMIDILGRAGKFNEVESLIEDMKITPNASIWERVLGACSIHGNVELGERAAEKLFEIDPNTDSNYILLSNLYASKGMWSDVSRVRASMFSKGIKKEPGCSWAEVDARVHIFLSNDVSHPRLLDIHQKLEELGKRVSEAGYVPNTKYVLQNVTDKEKREKLFHHSERLALGFSLISKVSSGKIRIFKNLRICGDCHEFMKFVSATIDQEIVVRDARRFHHFRSGSCSCKDYW